MLDFLKFQGSSIRGYDWTRYQFQSNYDKQTTMDTLKEFCEW